MRIVKEPDRIGENTCRIDYDLRPDLVFRSGLAVSEDGAIDLLAILLQAYDLEVVGGVPPLINKGAEYRHREARVIKLAI
jgi:hypothetical protein